MCFPGSDLLPCPPLCAGGGKKKLKRREREALLQQHGIALQGQLKHQQGGTDGKPAAGRTGGSADDRQHDGSVGQPLKPADDDDDIFGDAGTDYQPTIKDEKKKKAAAAAATAGDGQRHGSYFGGAIADLHADLPPLPTDGEEHLEGEIWVWFAFCGCHHRVSRVAGGPTSTMLL